MGFGILVIVLTLGLVIAGIAALVKRRQRGGGDVSPPPRTERDVERRQEL